MWPFFYFQYGIRSSRSTVDFLTVASDRMARGFNRSWTTRAAALDISKTFDRVCHAGLLHKLSRMKFRVKYLALFCVFSVTDGFQCFWMRSLHKNTPLMLAFLKGSLLILPSSCYVLITFLMMLSVK